MRTLTWDELTEHFDAVMDAVVDAVVDGESFVITHDGRAIADLTPRRKTESDREFSGTA